LELPEPIVAAIANSTYSRGESDITATQLINPPQMEALKVLHEKDLEEDAADLIYSLQGQSIHTILERAGASLTEGGWIVERRLYSNIQGWKVGAQIDVFNTMSGLLQDYKVTSVYSIKEGSKEEYVQQLNIGAELLRQNGYEVNTLQIVAILRDWSKMEYERELKDAKVKGFVGTKYPQHQVAILDVPMIPSQEVVRWLEQRVTLHQQSQEAAKRGEALLPCSKEERWAKDDVWAVKEEGKKKALKLFYSKEEAEQWVSEGQKIEHRPGVNTRCERYCSVARFCPQFKQIKEGKTNV
jgi:hypothetical protein